METKELSGCALLIWKSRMRALALQRQGDMASAALEAEEQQQAEEMARWAGLVSGVDRDTVRLVLCDTYTEALRKSQGKVPMTVLGEFIVRYKPEMLLPEVTS